MKTTSATPATLSPVNPNISAKTVARFISKLSVEQDTGCWIYTSAKFTNGYGAFSSDISPYAHRFSYAAFNGPLLPGKQVQHQCSGGGNKACSNPAHLKLNTAKQNSADAKAAGLLKAPRRKRIPASVAEITDIRARAKAGQSLYSIASIWNRAIPYISDVVNGRVRSGKPRKPRTPKSPAPSSPQVEQIEKTTTKIRNVYERLGEQIERQRKAA